MSPLREGGWALGSAHRVLNFASAATGSRRSAGPLCGLEGDAPAVEMPRPALSPIDGECFDVSSASKAVHHGAAVFCSKFTVVLQSNAQGAWREAGVSEASVPRLDAALLRATVAGTLALRPHRALTGPAARGDTAVVLRQGEAVAGWNRLVGDACRTLGELAPRLAQTGRTTSTGAKN